MVDFNACNVKILLFSKINIEMNWPNIELIITFCAMAVLSGLSIKLNWSCGWGHEGSNQSV